MLWHPDSFVYRDSIIGAVGRRAGALFFALHRDYFIVTQTPLLSIWTCYCLTVSP
jgi:hypothetical protein